MEGRETSTFRVSIHNGLSEEQQREVRALGGQYWEAYAGFNGRMDKAVSSVSISAPDEETALKAVRELIGDETGERAWRAVEMEGTQT